MAAVSADELKALAESGPLLRFAAEHVKDLDPDLPLAIAEAHQAAEKDQWTPQIAQRFWNAFAKLCDQIQPVTMDCLAAAQQEIEPRGIPRWLGWGKTSVAERSSSRYMFSLLLLLALILPIQLYVWTCTNLSKKIDELLASGKTRYAPLSQEFNKFDIETRYVPAESWSNDQRTRAIQIADSSTGFQDSIDRINAEVRLLSLISTGQRVGITVQKPGPQWYDQFVSVSDQFRATELRALDVQEKANLIIGVIGAYILPILFGTVGAIAYIIRTISEQIRLSTFATNSPTRHIMRAALGAMSGLVVGLFNDLSTKLSLPPLAIAFLAGYGVEALFSMFDGIIERFKQPKSDTQA